MPLTDVVNIANSKWMMSIDYSKYVEGRGLTWFKATSWYLDGETKENHERRQSV
jgi:hypothetical protein